MVSAHSDLGWVRPAEAHDVARIAEIYNYYVEHTVITFEEERVSANEIERRIDAVMPTYPWLVHEEAETVLAYAYAAPWHARSAYRYTAEAAIYCDAAHLGRGIGGRLYAALIEELRGRGFHCVIGSIAMGNDASVLLHEKLGFRKVGQFAQVGFKFGRWIDVGYWELLL